MKLNFTCVRFLLLFSTFYFLSPFVFSNNGLWGQNTGNAAGVPTFQCIGISWSGSSGNATTVCNVQYRISGSGAAWSNGFPLTFDTRAAGSGTTAARPANEYRGSLVNLTPGTTYEILLSLQGNSAINTFTCTTWSENFPIGITNIVANGSTALNITTGGSANGYALYTSVAGNTATIDVNNGAANCIYINAPYVIIRGLILKGAKVDAIKLGPNAHDIVIEKNDISGWGTVMSDGWGQNGDAAIRVSYQRTVERVIVQRNRIHHPRTNSNSWEQNRPLYGSNHPIGALAVNFETAGGNHVFRYNEIYSDINHYFMDGIGGAENFEFEGFPRANSDVYGNKVSHTWDDAIECEGGNNNVRIWGNYMDSTFVKIAVAATAIGPIYIFRNVSNYSRRSAGNASVADNEDRGPFIKAGSQDALYRGGKIYVFHNTVLQPAVAGYTYTAGCGAGILDAAGGPMTPVVSRNNILQIHKNWWQSIGDNFSGQTSNNFNYDLYNGAIAASNGQEANGWSGTPVYSPTNPAGVWALASTSKGYNTGAVLNNFNDGYVGTGPDAGAYEAGAAPLEFGVNAYTGNIPPVANAGSDITLTLPVNSTTLTGSGSDANGPIASYNWALVNGLGAFTLGNPNASSSPLTGLVQGTYVFRLTVTDNSGATATDDITITVNAAGNIPPTANAGNNITITLPVNTAQLTGTGADTDGNIASSIWTRTSGPAAFSFSTAGAMSTSVNGLTEGTYIFRLTVTDNNGATAYDEVTVIVNAAANQLPTANAGNNIVLTLPNNTTALIGSGTDADGTITAYLWTYVTGPSQTYSLVNANTASASVSNLIQGVYTFRLKVTDNRGGTATDEVNITVNAATAVNQAPIANAGTNIIISLPVNSTLLNGAGSTDPNGTITNYLWENINGTQPYTMLTPTSVTTQLTGLTPGIYVFRLTVTDNAGATDIDNVVVTVNAAANQLPTANAGNNITLTLPVNSTSLNGTGTDPDGNIIGYVWSRVTGPTNFVFGTPHSNISTLTGLTEGVYVFRLTVTDNNGASTSDEITVTVNPVVVPNQAPVARAGSDIVMALPLNATTLNGNTSADADGTIVSYAWSYVSGPSSYTFTSAGSTATGLNNLVLGAYIFRLTVTDNKGTSSTDDIKVTVNPAPNQPPTANAGNDIVITLPINYTILIGSGIDGNGVVTAYAWSKLSGPTSYALGNAASPTSPLTNLTQGVYVFKLTVTDNNGAASTDNITVVVNAAVPPLNRPPVANAGPDRTMTLPVNSTTLAGSGTDPDGTIVAYNWTRVSGPVTFLLSNGSGASTPLSNLIAGTYVFRLTVVDNYGLTATDLVTVTVNAAGPATNQLPVARTNIDSITLTLPVNTLTLNGNTSTDPDGIITSYEWVQVSGPAPAAISNGQTVTAHIANLTVGVYLFRLIVTDDDGASAEKTVKVTVKNQDGADIYFNIYPNPTSGNLTIQYIDNTIGRIRISVYDVLRKLVRDRFADKNQTVLTETLDLKNLKNGVYFLQLVLPDGTTLSKQFLKR